MNTPARLCFASLLVVGCGSPPVPLASFGPTSVVVRFDTAPEDPAAPFVSVELDVPGSPRLADDVVARLDGVPLAIADRGGCDAPVDGSRECTAPVLFLDRGDMPSTPPAVTVLTVADSSATFWLELDGLWTRTLALAAPADGRLHAGDAATFAWSPATDALQDGFGRYDAATPGQASFTVDNGTVDEATVRLAVPTDETPGRGTLSVLADGPAGTVTRCEGFAACGASLRLGAAAAVEVVP